MKCLQVILIFSLISITALADIQTTNVYYSRGATVRNEVVLHDMDYRNCVDIKQGSITLTGSGENSSGSLDATVLDHTLLRGNGGLIGSELEISAEEIQYAKGIAGGLGIIDKDGIDTISRLDEIKSSYLLSTGEERANFFNRYTSVNELLLSKENTYSAVSDVKPNSISLEGYGNRFSFDDKDSSLFYNLRVNHQNLWADTTGQLVATRINDVETTPVIYSWNVSVGSSGTEYAFSHFDMAFIAGDRQVDAQISGKDSNGLTVNVPVNGQPWHVDPIPDGSGSDDVKTMEDLIDLIRQGVSNSGYLEWRLVPN
jgi:hypothetical protein